MSSVNGGLPPHLRPLDGASDHNVVAFPSGVFDPDVIDRISEQYALVIIGSKALIIKQNGPNAPVSERIQFLTIEGFLAWFKNWRVKVGGKQKTYGELWLSDQRRRQYEGMEFVPGRPGEAVGRHGYINIFQGFDVEPEEGDCSVFIDHMFEVVCKRDGDLFNWVMSWFASIIQRPRERFGTSLVLKGGMGSGKSIVGEIIGSLFPLHYYLIDNPRYLTGQFNAHMASCLLLQADEGFWAGDKTAEGQLKGLVTSSHQMIEHKGVDPIRMPNYVRLLITSNEDWVVPAGLDERRFAVLEISNHRAQDTAYFSELISTMQKPAAKAALLFELLHWKIDEAIMRRPPDTEALWVQKLRSMDPVKLFIFEALREGEFTPRHGWPSWISTDKLHGEYRRHCERYGIRRPLDRESLCRQLKAIMPGMERKRRVIQEADERGTESSVRLWGYQLPHLPQARASFDDASSHKMLWEGEE